MDKKYLVKVESSIEFIKKKDAMIDMLGETLIMDADADLLSSTVEMTPNTIIFELVHQTIDDSKGTFKKKNIKKAIKSELGDVEITITRL